MKQRVAVAWSSGKDSAWMLCELQQRSDIEVAALLTTVREDDGSIGIHETSRGILQAQVDAAGIPLFEVSLPWPCPNEEYEKRLRDSAYLLLANDITALAFGDIFLQDIREYREQLFAETGLDLLFPHWQRDTAELSGEMISGGLRARISCISRERMPAALLGRDYDESFLRDLPDGVDPCGENGEFHTIVTDSPSFRRPLDIELAGSGADQFHSWLEFSPSGG